MSPAENFSVEKTFNNCLWRQDDQSWLCFFVVCKSYSKITASFYLNITDVFLKAITNTTVHLGIKPATLGMIKGHVSR